MATAIQALSAHARRWGASGCLGVGIAVAAASACNGDGEPAFPGLSAGGAGGASSAGLSAGGGGASEAASAGAGSGGGAGGAGGAVATPFDGPTSFTCNPNLKPAMDQIRALTSRQYLNTVADLITVLTGSSSVASSVLSDPSVTAAQALLQPNTPTIPLPLVDATATSAQNANTLGTAFPDGGWLRADQSIQQSRINGFYNFGLALAQVLTSPTYLGSVLGSCALGANAGNDMGCLTSFLQKVGPLVLRRAFNDSNHSSDLATYTAMFTFNGPDMTATNPAAAAYQDVITGLLNAPEFLYFVEDDPSDPPAAGGVAGVYQLNAYELASRLSYHVWDTMPDQALMASAANGSLLQPSVYQQQVDRLFADPRAQETLNQFFIDYFQTESVGGPRGTGGLNYHFLADPNALASPQFQAFAGANLPQASLYANMVDDAVGMANYYSAHDGTLNDLLTSPLSFAQTADVAKIYGLAPWDGMSAPSSFPDGQRPGLFTRALFTSAGIDTSPILKGVFLRRYVLCDVLGTPPALANGKSVPLTTDETTRQATTALTSGGPCNLCHVNWINPLGFATESFDGLGRYRTMQTLYTSTGTVADTLPVDTAVTPYVMMGDGTTEAATASDLVNLIVASDKPAACLARNYFRYTFARFEDLTLDACTLENMRTTVANGGQLANLWKSVTQTPLFMQRTIQ
jgi:hypothetical protein